MGPSFGSCRIQWRPSLTTRLLRGGVSERPKEAALKAARCKSLGGSNPSASAITSFLLSPPQNPTLQRE
jgi:hypothetical protein